MNMECGRGINNVEYECWPLVSVVVPIFNTAECLPRLLDSLIGQEYENLEIILINDGSTDSSSSICENYAKTDKRITLINQANMGVSAARNHGLGIAHGKYVSFIDSDDMLDLNMYIDLVRAMEDFRADVGICGVDFCTNQGELLWASRPGCSFLSQDELLGQLFATPNRLEGGCCNKLFKRDKLSGIKFDENLKMAEDFYFLCYAFSSCANGVSIDSVSYRVMANPNSATRKDEAEGWHRLLVEGKYQSIKFVRNHLPEWEVAAILKFLDDACRYRSNIRNVTSASRMSKFIKLLDIKVISFKVLLSAIARNKIPLKDFARNLYLLFV